MYKRVPGMNLSPKGPDMKPSQFKELIKARHKAGIKRPLLVESPPGIGKTQIPKQVAAELTTDVEDPIGFMVIHAPLLQPEDYGLPVITKDKEGVNFVVSHEKFPLEGSKCEKSGIFLIDELSQADNAAQKILANLIQEREIHGKRLKDGWSIVATGNRQTDRSGANRILGHLGNRLTRVELEVSLDDWTQWALANGVKPEVVAFIRFRPELLSDYNPNEKINATPRAWSEGVSASLGVIPPELEFETFKGDVREGPASEFLAFLKVYRDLPNIDGLLLDPKKAKVPNAGNTLYALCGAIAYRATVNNFGRALTYIRRLPPEFQMLFIRDVVSRDPELCHCREYLDWISNEGDQLVG